MSQQAETQKLRSRLAPQSDSGAMLESKLSSGLGSTVASPRAKTSSILGSVIQSGLASLLNCWISLSSASVIFNGTYLTLLDTLAPLVLMALFVTNLTLVFSRSIYVGQITAGPGITLLFSLTAFFLVETLAIDGSAERTALYFFFMITLQLAATLLFLLCLLSRLAPVISALPKVHLFAVRFFMAGVLFLAALQTLGADNSLVIQQTRLNYEFPADFSALMSPESVRTLALTGLIIMLFSFARTRWLVPLVPTIAFIALVGFSPEPSTLFSVFTPSLLADQALVTFARWEFDSFALYRQLSQQDLALALTVVVIALTLLVESISTSNRKLTIDGIIHAIATGFITLVAGLFSTSSIGALAESRGDRKLQFLTQYNWMSDVAVLLAPIVALLLFAQNAASIAWIFTSLLFLLCFANVRDTLIDMRNRFSQLEPGLGIVCGLVMLFFDIAVGFLIALCMSAFVVLNRQRRVNVVHARMSLSSISSPYHLSPESKLYLFEHGYRVPVYGLEGDVSYSKALSVLNEIRELIFQRTTGEFVLAVILDFEKVTIIDLQASSAFVDFAFWAKKSQIEMIVILPQYQSRDAKFTLRATRASSEKGDLINAKRSAMHNFFSRRMLENAEVYFSRNEALKRGEQIVLSSWRREQAPIRRPAQRLTAAGLESNKKLSKNTHPHDRWDGWAKYLGKEFGSEEDGKRFIGIMRNQRFVSGEKMIIGGTRAGLVFFLEDGEVSVVGNLGGKSIVFAVLGGGAILGEFGFFLDLPRAADVIANVSTEMYVLSRTAFGEMMLRDYDLAMKFSDFFIRHFSRGLVQSNQQLSWLMRN